MTRALAGGIATILLTGTAPTVSVHDAQLAVIRALPATYGEYFKYYCIAVNPGTLPSPASRASHIQSTRMRPDVPPPILSRLKEVSPRFVAASECGRTEREWDVIHLASQARPSLLVVVGQLEVVSNDHVRFVVFTSSGFLSETHTLYDLERTRGSWAVVTSKVLLQA